MMDENEQTQELHPAHPVAEDPEAHMGEEVPDPWDTDEPDWPAETVELPAEGAEEVNA